MSFTTSPMAFLDYRLAQSLSPDELDGRTTFIVVRLEPGADASAVRREIRNRLPYNDVYSKEEWASRSRGYWIESTGLGLTLFLTVALGALVGVVIVAQTLYASTTEHLTEFGTVKALGGGQPDGLRDHRRAGVVRGGAGLRPGPGADAGPGPGPGAVRHEDDRLAHAGGPGLRRDAGPLPGGRVAVVPQGGVARPGHRLPGLSGSGTEGCGRMQRARGPRRVEDLPRGAPRGPGAPRRVACPSLRARSWRSRGRRARARRRSCASWAAC